MKITVIFETDGEEVTREETETLEGLIYVDAFMDDEDNCNVTFEMETKMDEEQIDEILNNFKWCYMGWYEGD